MQNASEKQTAEQVRMCLRRGVHRMLDNMQQQRELEPSNVAAMVAELNRLKEVKHKTHQSRLHLHFSLDGH